ncbi:EamA family transporter [Paludibacterium yongneupense]|nr:EamA family transporter [Paludibacterium yongneupense]
MTARDVAQALAIVLIWGVNFAVIKWGVHGVPPLLLGALRFGTLAAVAVWFVPRPALPWRWLIAYALTVAVGQFGFLFCAIKFGMPAGLASVVLQAQVFFTLVLGRWLAREHWRREQLFGLVLALAGLFLIGIAHGSAMSVAGFVLTLLAALSWGASNIVVRLIGAAGHRIEPVGLVVWSSLIPPLPFLLLSWWLEGYDADLEALRHFSVGMLLVVLYLAFAASLLGYGLWSRLLSRFPANRVAPFSLLVPVIGLLTAWGLLGEQLTVLQASGSVCLLAALLVNTLSSLRRG